MHDTNDWPVAFLGSLYAGVVPVAVNTLQTADDYAYMLEHSRAHAVFVSARAAADARAAMEPAARTRSRTVVVSRGSPTAGTVELDDLLARQRARSNVPAATGADEPGFWLYSSGSTGRPKGTVHTHANLYWTAELYGKACSA